MSIEAKIIPLNQNPEPVKLVPANEAKIIPMFPNIETAVNNLLNGIQVNKNQLEFIENMENFHASGITILKNDKDEISLKIDQSVFVEFYKKLNLLKVVNGESPITQINEEISDLIDSNEG